MHTDRLHRLILLAITSVTALALSQLSSYWIQHHLAVNETLQLWPFLWLTHVQNHGGIFGSFQGSGWLFGLITACLLTGVVLYLLKAQTLAMKDYFFFGLIVGGGLSNVLDRLIYGGVVDYFDIPHIPFWHYIFNTADVLIHLGIWPLLLLRWSSHTSKQQEIQNQPNPNA